MSGGWNNGPVREVGEFGKRVVEGFLIPIACAGLALLIIASLVDFFVFKQR